MRKSTVRKYMLKNRVFLHLLFTDKKSNTTQRLSVCTNYQANVLINILNKIVTGEIPLKKTDFQALKRTRRLKFLKKVETGSELTKLLRSSRDNKVRYLKQFTTLFPRLLRQLFED